MLFIHAIQVHRGWVPVKNKDTCHEEDSGYDPRQPSGLAEPTETERPRDSDGQKGEIVELVGVVRPGEKRSVYIDQGLSLYIYIYLFVLLVCFCFMCVHTYSHSYIFMDIYIYIQGSRVGVAKGYMPL